MNYQRIYNELMNNRKTNPHLESTYTEKHHIVPKSHGGGNSKDNLVHLSAREHFIAHWLLWRIHKDRSMAWALRVMCTNRYGNRHINSRAFEEAKKAVSHEMKIRHISDETRARMSKATTGRFHSDEVKKRMSESKKGELHHFYGKHFSEEHKMKLSKSNTGKKHSEETKRMLSERQKNGNSYWYGKKQADEHKIRISEAMKNRAKITCPHCNKEGYDNNFFKKWHFYNCKLYS